MNIFLDSTVFYNDPFLEKIHSKSMVEICRHNGFGLFISEVVLKEVKRHYANGLLKDMTAFLGLRKKLEKENIIYANSSNELNIERSLEFALQRFDNYYERLAEQEVITIVGYDKEILSELINRSIHRIKPFTEEKQEFRDAVIWLSYVEISKEKDLGNCILVTNNSSDYLKNEELHPDLKNDSEKFTVIRNTYGLIHSPLFDPYKVTLEEFKESLEEFKGEWSENPKEKLEIVLNALHKEDIYREIEFMLDQYIQTQPISNLFNGYKEINGSAKLVELRSINETNWYFEGIKHEIVMNGDFRAHVSIELNIENSEENSTPPQTKNTSIEVFFSGIFNKDTNTLDSIESRMFRSEKEENDELQFMNYSNHL